MDTGFESYKFGEHLIIVDFGSMKTQESSICEYTRLKSIYGPDLLKFKTLKPPRKMHIDRQWALRKTVAEAHEVVTEKKKRKVTYKKEKLIRPSGLKENPLLVLKKQNVPERKKVVLQKEMRSHKK